MIIKKSAQAGSLESSDILIRIDPVKSGSGVIIDIDSPAKKQFGEMIHSEITEVINRFDIKDIKITAIDKGSLSYCIKARTETAIKRAMGEEK